MTDRKDELNQLWQQQPTHHPDLQQLKRAWRKTRLLQWLYMVLDILSLIVIIMVFNVLDPTLSHFQMIWLTVVIAITLLFTGYVIWLRRFAWRANTAATHEYRMLLIKQYQQNIRLTKATKISMYCLPLVFLSYFVIGIMIGEFQWQSMMLQLTEVSIYLALILPLIWIWADRRQQRFTAELHKLTHSDDDTAH